MNNIINMNTNNNLATTLSNENSRFTRYCTFCKKVTQKLISPRNCLIIGSSTIASALSTGVYLHQRSIANSPDKILEAILCTNINVLCSTFVCMTLFAMIDASEPEEQNTSQTIALDDSTTEVDIENQIETCSSIENRLLSIKNKLKSIDKSEAFMYLCFMALLMLFGSVCSISSCKDQLPVNFMLVPSASFLVFSVIVIFLQKCC